MMNYSQYLFGELLKTFFPLYTELPYDVQYDVTRFQYTFFKESVYNDPDMPEYECMEMYLKDDPELPNIIEKLADKYL